MTMTAFLTMFNKTYSPIVLRHIAQQIHSAIQMRNGHNFTAHIIINAIHRICIDETVSNPQTCFYLFVDLSQNLNKIEFNKKII